MKRAGLTGLAGETGLTGKAGGTEQTEEAGWTGGEMVWDEV